ncbi:DUF2061 domain-containing protein [Ahrensia kielensis]|uniref:DUF2061 domain-containing protein n=1 Tax=Ahrensia kielensis TaxID=76980 RepID=A0ABU9T8J0_9HYPH|nr:DUF2061 domain-containing protein [Ahrensia kielensis]
MELPRRTFVKAITWQLLGIATMTLLALFQSGNLIDSIMLALSASATGFVFYFIHERFWSKIRWGRRA